MSDTFPTSTFNMYGSFTAEDLEELINKIPKMPEPKYFILKIGTSIDILQIHEKTGKMFFEIAFPNKIIRNGE